MSSATGATNLEEKLPLGKKILSIEKKDDIDIPIVKYPPLKLRSSLYDKDPVIWAHLLEEYIQLASFLANLRNLNGLTVSTASNIKTYFVQPYLQETVLERTNVLTLGAVNPQITENNKILKQLMFELVENHGLRETGVVGAYLWYFIQIYIREFPDRVRNSVFSAKISVIPTLVVALEEILVSGQLKKLEFEDFGFLLGVGSTSATSRKLAAQLVTQKWISILERYFGDGKSVHSEACKKLMGISILSLDLDSLYSLVYKKLYQNLHFKSRQEFVSLYPLLYSMLASDFVESRFKSYRERFSFLLPSVDLEVRMLTELFPQLSIFKAKSILSKFDNAEAASMAIIENPIILEDETESPAPAKIVSTESKSARFKSEEPILGRNVIFGKKKKLTMSNVNDEFDSSDVDLKKKTLEAALATLYDSDEDEPDDSYLEAEIFNSEHVNSKKGTLDEVYGSPAPVIIKTEDPSADSRKTNKNVKNSEDKRKSRKGPKQGDKGLNHEEKGPNQGEKEPRQGEKGDGKSGSKEERARNQRNKSKYANHNRKAGHDKKIARAL